MFQSLVEHFVFPSYQNGGFKKLMTGGADVAKNTSGNGLMLFLITLSFFIIKILLVMISYNVVIPRILNTYSVDMRRWRQITFLESIFLVILFNNLFSRF